MQLGLFADLTSTRKLAANQLRLRSIEAYEGGQSGWTTAAILGPRSESPTQFSEFWSPALLAIRLARCLKSPAASKTALIWPPMAPSAAVRWKIGLRCS